MDIFWDRHKPGLFLMTFINLLGVFLKVKVQNRNNFGGCLIPNTFLVMPDFFDFFIYLFFFFWGGG